MDQRKYSMHYTYNNINLVHVSSHFSVLFLVVYASILLVKYQGGKHDNKKTFKNKALLTNKNMVLTNIIFYSFTKIRS